MCSITKYLNNKSPPKASTISWMLLIQVLVVLLQFVDYAQSDYENTWNLYYEQPCCMGSQGGHHLKHHKGKLKTSV